MVELGNILEVFRYDADSPLIVTGGWFLFIFTIFYAILMLFRNQERARIAYIVLFSLYYYYKTSGLYLLVLVLMSVSDYQIAKGIYSSFSERHRKRLLALSVVLDVSVLCYFKYTNFFWDLISPLLNNPFEIEHIFLPAGISFFVFQSISYVADIYNGSNIKARNYLDYLFFLSFFPHILAGPIMRADKFIPQLDARTRITKKVYDTAFFLLIVGLIKKAIVSDYISVNFVDPILDDPIMYTGFQTLLATYGYTLQIYCDFSGYSDIAIGLALLVGYRLPLNFDRPYLSATPTEFWRRWHITLSSWLRDYLYIPLGGNRKGKITTYLNLITTMLIGGLWHGASLRFIFWGFWHGAGLCIHKALHNMFPAIKLFGKDMSRRGRVIGTIITFHFVCIGWIFFRATTFDSAETILIRIFTDFSPELISQVVSDFYVQISVLAISYVYMFLPEKVQESICDSFLNTSFIIKIIAMVAVCWLILQLQSGETQAFIYYQF